MLVCTTKGFPVKLKILSQADCLGNRSELRTSLKQFLCCRRRKEEVTFGENNKPGEKSFKKASCSLFNTPQLIKRQGQDSSPGPSDSVSDFNPASFCHPWPRADCSRIRTTNSPAFLASQGMFLLCGGQTSRNWHLL